MSPIKEDLVMTDLVTLLWSSLFDDLGCQERVVLNPDDIQTDCPAIQLEESLLNHSTPKH